MLKKSIFLIIIFVLFMFSFSALAQTYEVEMVIDGESIQLTNGDQVRYIGIESPKFHWNADPDPYALEAYEVNKKLVDWKKVRLEFDIKHFDENGLVLAYVYVDDLFVNAWLIENGFAKALLTPPNTKYNDLFLKLESKAKENKAGLWGVDVNNYVPYKYIGNKNTMIFHQYWCPYVDLMDSGNKVKFTIKQEAIDQGYKACGACHL